MSSIFATLRSNPQLLVGVALFLGIILVLTLVGLIMRGAGASLRPIVFMAVLMLPLAVVFIVAGLVNARMPQATAEPSFSLPIHDGVFADREKLFGPDIPESQIRDAKAVFPEFFVEAEHAELGVVGNGESVLVAQFPTVDATKRCAKFMWEYFQVTNTGGDEENGWRGKRGLNQDYFEMLRSGRQLFLWTALTKDACAARRAVSNVVTQSAAFKPTPPEPMFPALQPLATFFQPVGVKVAGVLLMCFLYTLWFFKGAGWAASSPAVAGVPVASASTLASRIEALNTLDVPFHVERGAEANEFFITWRYADAKWVDLARAHGMRRTFRIRMLLDEQSHTVRATDYFSNFDWSAGQGGANIQWQAGLGIVFFQYEKQKVFGLQLDEQNRFKPELSYEYTFNLDEMKSPLRQAVTQSGWNWRPTVWMGPKWLRWLTE